MSLTLAEVDLESELKKFDLEIWSDRVAVKEFELKTTSGLFIPDTAKDAELKTNEGVIVAIGSEVDKLAVGDVIYYGRYAGTRINRNNGEFRVLNYGDIIGKVRPSNG